MNDLFELLTEALGFNQPIPPLPEIVFAIALSFALNLLVATVYQRTYRGGRFSQEYVHTLLILGTCIAVIVMVVRVDREHSHATAFGIFAAFSIIRFRTLLQGPRDIAFLFVAMSAGLGVGARVYGLATATTILICSVIYVFSRMDIFAPARASHYLRIRVTNDVDYDQVFTDSFKKYLNDSDMLSVESIQAGMMTELLYLVHLKDSVKPREFVSELQQLNGNNRVLLTTTTPNRMLTD
jgi:uncharacterized membrane protein YhiD involved in acid resistance